MMEKKDDYFHRVQFVTDIIDSYIKCLRNGAESRDIEIPKDMIQLFVMNIDKHVSEAMKVKKGQELIRHYNENKHHYPDL